MRDVMKTLGKQLESVVKRVGDTKRDSELFNRITFDIESTTPTLHLYLTNILKI